MGFAQLAVAGRDERGVGEDGRLSGVMTAREATKA